MKLFFTIAHGYKYFKSEFSELSKKKAKNAQKNGVRFSKIGKLTIKIDSCLTHINKCYHLKFPIPILHIVFFRILSQHPEYVKTSCNEVNISFSFRFSQINNQPVI